MEHWASRMSLPTLSFEKISLVGVRGIIDEAEKEIIRQKKIRKFESVTKVLNFIKKTDSPVHISFDVSALDPEICNSTGNWVDGGMEPE